MAGNSVPLPIATAMAYELWVLHEKPEPLHDGNACYTCNVLQRAADAGVVLSAAVPK